ncbi:hypothetical protein Lal_00008441 [Lupinus albus]|nr:hypothetical protein Lal_00008441 [Lupinus albus]
MEGKSKISTEWRDQWKEGAPIEGAETYQSFVERTNAAIRAALDFAGPVLIIAHGGVYWSILETLRPERPFPKRLENCDILGFLPQCKPLMLGPFGGSRHPKQKEMHGAAGFIGYHVAEKLLKEGTEVIGCDNLNDYYDVSLKIARLERLKRYPNFSFYPLDITSFDALKQIMTQHPNITHTLHLAAQAGVRHSLIDPFAYARSNILGHLNLLEALRSLQNLEHFVYASSSSVYGANEKQPFSTEDRVDQPLSLYAATKRAGELMSYCYSHLYPTPTTGLRYFTVYGPWGRPDMSSFIFTEAMLNDREIPVF